MDVKRGCLLTIMYHITSGSLAKTMSIAKVYLFLFYFKYIYSSARVLMGYLDRAARVCNDVYCEGVLLCYEVCYNVCYDEVL